MLEKDAEGLGQAGWGVPKAGNQTMKRGRQMWMEKGSESSSRVGNWGVSMDSEETEEQEQEKRNSRRGSEGQQAMENRAPEQKGEGEGLSASLRATGVQEAVHKVQLKERPLDP